MRWIDRIVDAFENLGGVVHYSDLYEYIENNAGEKLSASWQDIIRREIQYYSSDCKVYQGKEDLFFSIGGLGNGMWGLRSDIDEIPEQIDLKKVEPERKDVTTSRIIRDTYTAKKLKVLYQHTCQFCGTVINTGRFCYSEVHHIQPLGSGHRGSDTIDNMLVLCPNHHTEIDYGAFYINPKTLRLRHADSRNDLNNEVIRLASIHLLNPEYIQYNNKVLYQG